MRCGKTRYEKNILNYTQCFLKNTKKLQKCAQQVVQTWVPMLCTNISTSIGTSIGTNMDTIKMCATTICIQKICTKMCTNCMYRYVLQCVQKFWSGSEIWSF